MNTIALLAISFPAMLLFSCKKETNYHHDMSLKKPVFNYEDSVDPVILKLMWQDLMKDGYTKKAETLLEEYDLQTGARIRTNTDYSFPATNVPGAGLVLASVNHTQNVGTTNSYFNATANTVSFNTMNSAVALHAFKNTAPPGGTFLASGGRINGINFPIIKSFVYDITGKSFQTPSYLLSYAVAIGGSVFSPYVLSNTIAGSKMGCGSTGCYITDLKIKFLSSSLIMNLWETTTGIITWTQVRAYIYYRTSYINAFGMGSTAWNNWVSEDIPCGTGTIVKPLRDIQIRIYLVEV